MSHAPSDPPGTLTALRERIDAVDRELLALLNRRAQLALEVGEIKKREGSVVFRPEREAQVIDGLKANEEIVTTAMFLIDAESNLQTALQAFSQPEPAK